MCDIIAQLVLCSEFGGYAHAMWMPNLPRSLALWWYMKLDSQTMIKTMLKLCPNYVLFAWKEAVVWALRLRPDLLEFVQATYDWVSFSQMTVDSMNRIRRYMHRRKYLDAVKLDILSTKLHDKMKSPSGKRILRCDFFVAFLGR